MQRAAAFLLLLVLLAGSARAQTVEYTIPTEYELVAGRLSVTFADTTSEAEARRVLETFGYAVLDSSRFVPVRVEAMHPAPFSETQRAALEALPEVSRVTIHAEHPPPSDPLHETPRYVLDIALDARLTKEEATAIVRTHAPEWTITSVDKRPNELTILLPEDAEDEAVERLGAHPLVRYVAYLVAP